MAHRADEKEKRRQERLAQERAAAAAAKRKRTFGLLGGLLLAGAAIAAIVLVLGASGDEGRASASEVTEQAQAAGCTFKEFPEEGADHVNEELQPADYKTNPATSGRHNPTPAQDGFYRRGDEPDLKNWVHALEHGRVLFQYKTTASDEDVQKLRALAGEELEGTSGYHTLVFQNNTNMPANFAAVSWTRSITCDRLTPKALDAMRMFRRTYTDQAPELIP